LGVTANVMLKDGLSPNDRDGILAVTPEDVARSPSTHLALRHPSRLRSIRWQSYDEALKCFRPLITSCG
jgi:hypothetical protein